MWQWRNIDEWYKALVTALSEYMGDLSVGHNEAREWYEIRMQPADAARHIAAGHKPHQFERKPDQKIKHRLRPTIDTEDDQAYRARLAAVPGVERHDIACDLVKNLQASGDPYRTVGIDLGKGESKSDLVVVALGDDKVISIIKEALKRAYA